MDDCRALWLWCSNQPALGAVRRWGQYPARAGAASAVQVLAAQHIAAVMLSALINVCAFWW